MRRVRVLALGVLVLTVFAVHRAAPPAAAVSAPTIVSIQFDDGNADQVLPARMLEHHGMRGTFFLISGRLGHDGYFSYGQALALQRAGHEIGGHTIDHKALPTMTRSEQRNELCADRATLLQHRLRARFLAYPFGRADATSRWYAAACGYDAARGEDGVQCTRCESAEGLPPLDLFYLRAPYSANETTTLAELEQYVTRAEDGGGGWLHVIFHHVCTGCADGHDEVSPSRFGAFLDWLTTERAHGVQVETYSQAMPGPLQPADPDPPTPPQSVVETNLVHDPSFEDPSGACWSASAIVATSALFQPSSTARTGSRGETVTAADGADTQIAPVRDQSATCDIPATAGDRFSASVWHVGPARANFVAYYFTGRNWLFWTSSSAILFATATWEKAAWVTPPVPDGARAIAVGIQARKGGGRITVDDLAVSRTDAEPPAVALEARALPAGKLELRAIAVSTHSPIARVVIAIAGRTPVVLRRSPYVVRLPWPNGRPVVTATATDASGLGATSRGLRLSPTATRPQRG